MSNHDKQLITDIILKNLPSIHPWNDLPFEKILFKWWATGRSNSSLRLTEDGKIAFELAEIEFYEYPLITNTNQIEEIKFTKYTIQLGKKIKCPFYIGHKNRMLKSAYIRLYDSKIAMMVSLYGSFHEYFNSLTK